MMTARIIVGPWPGSSNIIPLHEDVRLEFARRVEQRLYNLEAQQMRDAVSVMRGSDAPADTEQHD